MNLLDRSDSLMGMRNLMTIEYRMSPSYWAVPRWRLLVLTARACPVPFLGVIVFYVTANGVDLLTTASVPAAALALGESSPMIRHLAPVVGVVPAVLIAKAASLALCLAAAHLAEYAIRPSRTGLAFQITAAGLLIVSGVGSLIGAASWHFAP